MRDRVLEWLKEHEYSAALLPGEGADENVEAQLRAGTLPVKILVGLDGKNELSPQYSQVRFFQKIFYIPGAVAHSRSCSFPVP